MCAARLVSMLFVVFFCLFGAAHAETRTLKLYNTHTKERVSITFKKNGRYIPAGLREANRFLRDWRRNEIIKMDPELLDLIWEVYRKAGGRDHIHVVSSYRSPATNNMLRSRSKGVARNSQHTLGKAMDFYIPGVNLAKLRAVGLRKEVGGVGYYPRSGSPFVHMDTGRVRHWPRMSRKQLVKVFPNGKTLHIPTDGKPLKGYKIALAESKTGKKTRTSRPTIVASNTRDRDDTNPSPRTPVSAGDKPASGGGNLFAGLFNRANASSEPASNATARPGAVGNKPKAPLLAEVLKNPPVPARKVIDVPQSPSTEEIVVASAAPLPASPPAAASAPQPTAPGPASNTLDAQRVALESGQTPAPAPVSEETIDSRFQVARAPAQKPDASLSEAAKVAAANLGVAPVPVSAATDDPVAAIAAATGTSVPRPAPTPPRPETTLAYAPPTAASPAASSGLSRALERSAAARSKEPARPEPTVSGRIPRDQIVDPLAGFASLPDKEEATILNGTGTTRGQAFAWLKHPNQREIVNVMRPGNRFLAFGFATRPYGSLGTDRFEGPAVVVLPVRFAR